MDHKEKIYHEMWDRIKSAKLINDMYYASDLLLQRADRIKTVINQAKMGCREIENCDSLTAFMEVDSCIKNHIYDYRYGNDLGGCYISAEEVLEISDRIRQMHDAAEDMVRKINSMEKIIENRMIAEDKNEERI